MKTDPTQPEVEELEPVDLGTAIEALPEAVARPEAKELNFIQAGRQSFKQTLKEGSRWGEIAATPYGLKPVLIFAFLSIALSLDTASFSLLLPEIIRDRDFRVGVFLQVLNFVSGILIFVGIGAAYFADRVKRVPMVAIPTMLAGVMTFLTGRSNTQAAIGSTRVGDGVSKSIAGIPVNSLLADYYPPQVRGKAFAAIGVLVSAGTLFAPVFIALLGRNNWRTPFYVFAPFIFLGGLLVMTMREPVRGFFERKSMGAEDEVANTVDEAPSMGEAWRTVWAIRTLRRIFISTIFESAGNRVFASFWILFLVDRYGLTVTERAYIGVLTGVFLIAGGYLGGGVVDVLMRRRPQRVLVFQGLLGVGSAIAIAIVVTGPPLPVLVGTSIFFGFLSALLGPASGVIYAQIVPSNIRSLGFAVQGLAAIPGTIITGVVIGFLLQRGGFQGALFAAVPFFFISSLISLSAAGFFERDMRAAFASAIASDEWRRAKKSGKGKLLVSRDVDVEYDGVQVLFGVDFDVEEGEIIALLGTNGAGKSTLLRAISGTQEASSGAIVFDGRDITHMPPHEIAGRGVIHMPGGRGVFPGLSVAENLRLGTWVVEEGERQARLDEVYKIFPILKQREDAKAGSLSGGEQQMVALAQAFLSKPRLLMIDELSLGLSPAVVQELIEVVRRIHATGVTIIVVEQSVNVALTIAEKAIFMEKGEVKFFGYTKDLLRRPDILRAVYVKGTGAVKDGAPASAMKTERELRQYELGHARTILEVKGLSKAYGGVKAVDDVSFALKEGEALGLIGPNGAGKTTVFDLISGYQIPDGGEVIFDGNDVSRLRADERSKKKLIRRFQDARLFPSLTVYENILVALDHKVDVKNMALTAIQVPQVRASERRVRLRADKLIDLLEIGAFRDKFVKELSTGLRRIVDIACVLAAEPKVLMLDEPSSGIAQSEAEGLGPLLRRVRYETGCSMLVIEHDMPLISAVSDELIALVQGRFLMKGSPEEVLNDERVIQSYLGTSEEVVQRSGVLK